MIAAGRVRVDGKVVTEMGHQADPDTETIEVDGKPVSIPQAGRTEQAYVYIALNKPEGVVTTAKDTHGRPTVLDIIGRKATGEGRSAERSAQQERPVIPRVFPVGRLDADTTGLLLLTNDGDLTFRLTHPRFGVEKEYHALVRGRPSEEALQRLRSGVEIEGEMTSRARVTETGHQGNNTFLRITIHEGRKRQVRLMLAAVGHHVISLQRVRFGPLKLGDLRPGAWRYLAMHEVHALKKAVNLMR
jgi:23S rRNA pseudouridine2605 synthase